MMHHPVDYNDVRLHTAETLPIPNGEARRAVGHRREAVVYALCAARMGVGALLMGGDHKGRAYKRDDQSTPQRHRTHRAPRTGAK